MLARAPGLPLALPLAALAAMAGFASAQPAGEGGAAAVVRGHVTNAGGAGVPFASVRLAGTPDGAATDADGSFQFSARRTGARTLRASAIGYAEATRRVHLAAGDTLGDVVFVLEEAVSELGEAVVTARREPPAPLSGAAVLDPLEAVTTAGAAGDPLRAVRLLPGAAAAASDGSGLFVRGGDKSETRVLVDGAALAHPYRQETPTGGAFGTLPPFLVEGTRFSAGGFSARHGGALSGVLALRSRDRPREVRGTASLGLAAASVRAGAPLSERLGARVSVSRSFTGLLFRVNGQADAFPTPPRAADAGAEVTYRYGDEGSGRTGRLKLFGFAGRSRLAANEQAASFNGLFENQSTTQLYFAGWQHTAGPWRLEATLSADRRTAAQAFGALRTEERDRSTRLRFDAERAWGSRLTLAAGGEAARRVGSFRGEWPAAPGPQPSGAQTFALDAEETARTGGGYVEARARPTDRLSLRAGVRADGHSSAGRPAWPAPRLGLRYRLGAGTHLRLAWGRYRQFPALEEIAQARLGAERAQHFIAGVHHERGPWRARLEAYAKSYDGLVVPRPAGAAGRYANDGDGYAYGLDAFARYGAFLRTRVSGWATYSFLRTRRTQLRQVGTRQVLERGPAPFDATHSLTLVGKARVAGGVYVGGTFRWATGRPVTPVTGGVPGEDGARVLPVEGAVGSERRPAFRRLDVQVSYYRPFDGGARAATFYASLAGALGRRNVNGYAYDADYSNRRPIFSPYRRLFYAGVTVDF